MSLSTPSPAWEQIHAPTCRSWRCAWEWQSPDGSGVCRLPKDAEIHYVGTVDSHAFIALPCDCSLAERVRSYLGNGGLFNPELMEHDKVRQLIMDLESARAADTSQIAELKESEGRAIQVAGECRDRIYELEQQVAALSTQVERWKADFENAVDEKIAAQAQVKQLTQENRILRDLHAGDQVRCGSLAAELAQLRQQGAEKEQKPRVVALGGGLIVPVGAEKEKA